MALPDALPADPDRAWRTWHFALHVIPDLPEALITGKQWEYFNWFLRRKAANPEVFSDADLDELAAAALAGPHELVRRGTAWRRK